uniref:Uncharacterized protein n=1 Tax=Arundo donax TaxID=35708 RepID=A0A0A8XNP5_ARUDO
MNSIRLQRWMKHHGSNAI